jgi:hypothetical protein
VLIDWEGRIVSLDMASTSFTQEHPWTAQLSPKFPSAAAGRIKERKQWDWSMSKVQKKQVAQNILDMSIQSLAIQWKIERNIHFGIVTEVKLCFQRHHHNPPPK